MIKALFTSATGMEAQQLRISVIANNIANMNTTGYKQSRAEFEDLLYETKVLPGSETAAGVGSPNGIQIGSGVKVVGTQTQFSQGVFEQTGGSLDVAIEGKGFFAVQLPSGELGYTRSGSLAIDAEGNLVNQDGFPMVPSIQVQPGGLDRRIGVDGTVTARVPPATTPVSEGTIGLYLFANESGLQHVGRNTYIETTASGAAQQGAPGDSGFGTLQQGFLESSNVNIAEELIRMILAQRAYELNGKVIQTADQVLNSTTNLR